MKLAFVLVSLVALSQGSANAAPPPRCENVALIKSLGKLHGSKSMKVVGGDSEARLEIIHGTSRDVAIRVTCDAIEMPIADQVERPTKGSATRVVDGITLSRTANGSVSFDFPAQLLDPSAVQMLVLDDDSISIVRGDKVYYAFATKADGTVVETEGVGNGCGCERTTTPDGTVTHRRLAR